MSHPMFTYDAELANEILEFCRRRLALAPVPLDFGSLQSTDMQGLRALISSTGTPGADVLAFFEAEIAPAVVSADSPQFLAFIPNAPTKASLLFDMVVACSGLNGTSWLESAGAVRAENEALRFLAERAGLPERAGGVFVSGGTMGNLSALTVGRDVGRQRRSHVAPHELRFAVSSDAHSSVAAALHILGISALIVPTDDHRLTAAHLEAALASDPHRETVIGVIATCGTTNAGIIDDLEGVGTLCRQRNLWFHVDGAYGGGALFSRRHEETLRGLRHADSFIVDPHKWLFAPLDCAALLYRDPELARTVHTQHAGYLDILHHAASEAWNPSDYAIHLSRRPRGLSFWFSLATHGVTHYETAVTAAIDTAHAAAALIRSSEHLELIREPELSVVLFRRIGWTSADYDQWALQLLRDQVAFVAPSTWEGESVARLAFLHPDTTLDLVAEIIESMNF